MDAVDFVIISVGDELLRGRTIDMNSAWLSSELSKLGCRTVEHSTVADDVVSISSAIERAQQIADGCIVTGGLGPTIDDVTRDALSYYLRQKLVIDEDLLGDIERRYSARGMVMPDPPREALVPVGTTSLKNGVGIAPGILFRESDRLICLLPGVPHEMKDIFKNQLEPIIRGIAKPSDSAAKSLFTTGIPESVIAAKIARSFDSLKLDSERLSFYPSTFGVEIRIGGEKSDANFKRRCSAVRDICRHWCYSTTEGSLPVVVGELLSSAGRTVATAESCTGGLLASRMVDVPGASGWFEGGVVSYSNRAKAELLTVDSEKIERFGAVSAEVASQMARGAAERFHANYALSTTGIAGPSGGTDEKPVGLVYYAMDTPHGTYIRRNIIAGGRKQHRERTSQAALAMLWLELSGRYESHEWADGSIEVKL